MNVLVSAKQQSLMKQTIQKMPVSQSIPDFLADAIDHYVQHLKKHRYQIR